MKMSLKTLLALSFVLSLPACHAKSSSDDSSLLLLSLLRPAGSSSGGSGGGGGGGGSPSTPITTSTTLTTTSGDTVVNLSWTTLGGATSYNIYYATSPAVTTASTKINTASSSFYAHNGLTNSGYYYYRIAGLNTAGEGPLSTMVGGGPDLWTAATSGTTNTLYGVRYINGEFWVVGNGIEIKSADGITWSSAAISCASGLDYMMDLATDGTKINIVGWSGRNYYYNGSTWSCGTLPSVSYYWFGIKYLSGLWIMYGRYMNTGTDYRAAIAVSTDGVTWNIGNSGALITSTSSIDALRDAIVVGGQYSLVGSHGWIANCSTSCGTIGNWTTGQVSSLKQYSGVYYRSGTYTLVTSNSTPYDTTTNWSTFSPITASSYCYRIVDRSSEILGVGGSGYVRASQDGVNWLSRASAGFSTTNAVDCSATRCVAVGYSGSIQYR